MMLNVIFSQRLYDNGPLTGDGDYVLQGSKWNKTTLTYYIYNSSSHLTAAQRESAIQAAFKLWSDNSVLNFIQVSTPNQADLKLKWAAGNHGDGHPFDGNVGVLAHAFSPPPAGGSYAGELHFDDDENWSIDGSGIDLVTVAAHEIGHLLGISHSDDMSALMFPFYSGINRNLNMDDRLAIWDLYGYPFSISGPSQICDSAIYTIDNIPTGSTVAWSIEGSEHVEVTSGQGTPTVTLQRQQGSIGAFIRLLATINIYDNEIPVSKRITLGTASPSFTMFDPAINETPSIYSTGALYDLRAYGAPTSSYYYWTIDKPSYYGGRETVVLLGSDITYRGNMPGRYEISVRQHTTSCGWSADNMRVIMMSGLAFDDRLLFSIYPNPATDLLTVELTENEMERSNFTPQSRSSSVHKQPYTIQLWSETQGLVRTAESTESITQISLHGLPKGMYFVHIIVNGETVERKTLWVK